MFHLIIGGSGSGKSEYAETVAKELFEQLHKKNDLVYIATMYHYPDADGKLDAETTARIKKHQKQRAGKGFKTIEQYTNIKQLWTKQNVNISEEQQLQGDVYLLECMSNLLANEMYLSDGNLQEENLPEEKLSEKNLSEKNLQKRADKYIIDPICQAVTQGNHLVVVTNEVFSDGNEKNYDESTQNYIKVLGYINKKLAEKADYVTEVCCGIPVQIKTKSNN